MRSIISFLINWNSLSYTLKAVESLLGQSIPPHSIFILDNNSNNFEGEKLQQHFANTPQVKVFLSAENLGFAKGMNYLVAQALKKENPEFLFFLNNDAIADEGWIEALLNCHKETGSQLITSKMLQLSQPELIDNIGHTFLNTGEVIPTGHNQKASKFTTRQKTIGASGGAMFVTNKLWQQLGGFDEHFFVGYEDADFGLRAFLTGHDIYFEPKAIVKHKMGASIKKMFNYTYTLTQFRNINYAYFKLMPTSFLVINFPFFIIKQLIVFLMNLLFLRFKFLKVMLHSTWLLFTKDLKVIKKARKEFYATQVLKRSWWEIQKASTFFLWFDIKRFWRFMILREKNQFEKY